MLPFRERCMWLHRGAIAQHNEHHRNSTAKRTCPQDALTRAPSVPKALVSLGHLSMRDGLVCGHS